MKKPIELKSGGFVFRASAVRGAGKGNAEKGLSSLEKQYGAKAVRGPGTGTSDSVKARIDGKHQARLSNREAYVPPEKVKAAGGAKKLQSTQSKLSRKAR